MTKNQIEFNKLLETQRANQREEELTRVRDERTYALGQDQLAEAARHNRTTEKQYASSLDETARSNRAREYETARSNKQRELETHRSNLAHESELFRSNVSREAETRRANLAAEAQRRAELRLDTEIRRGQLAETRRSNRAHEAIGWGNVSLGYSQLSETARANREREALGRSQLAEDKRRTSLNAAQRAREIAAREESNRTQRYSAETGRLQYQTDASRAKAQNFRDYSSGINSIIRSAGSAVSMIIGR